MDAHQPAAATREDLTARCGHECLNRPDHEGPHFYGYVCGPYSYKGLLARVAELEAGIREHQRWRGLRDHVEGRANRDLWDLLEANDGR
jgi:hypothetical protein